MATKKLWSLLSMPEKNWHSIWKAKNSWDSWHYPHIMDWNFLTPSMIGYRGQNIIKHLETGTK